jgi:hypothetical protein
MAPPVVTLTESINGILDAMKAALVAEQGEGNELAKVKAVVRGPRARPQPDMPALWLVPEPARNNQTTQGLAESWTMAVHVAALVKSADEEAGPKLAAELAAKGRAVILAYQPEGGVSPRRLGLPYVNDIVSTSFDPFGNRGPENRVLHWADAVITVRWRTGGGV